MIYRIALLIGFVTAAAFAQNPVASTPPMGWNSYDSFGDSVTEAEVMANADYMKEHLLSHGYQYVVVDFRWYDPGAHSGNPVDRTGAKLEMDSHGRLQPAPNRFPSAAGGKGFGPLAEQIHSMGLKFGIHIMRGIPRWAVKLNDPIDGSSFKALDAANLFSTCVWCGDMFGVDATTRAGQDWYDSIFRQYAQWGVDFVKVDDLSRPYSGGEIEAIRKAIDRSGRPMVFSTSPGETPIGQARNIAANANMWRVSDDFWDQWRFLDHAFDLAFRWQGVGGSGHWPDLDMIPLGHIALRSIGPPRMTRFTKDEQRMLMSMWALFPSPLMLGMNLPDNDPATLELLTNDAVLAVNQDAAGNAARRAAADRQTGTEIWAKKLSSGDLAVGLFNRGSREQKITLNGKDVDLSGAFSCHDLWNGTDTKADGSMIFSVPSHGAVLVRVKSVQ